MRQANNLNSFENTNPANQRDLLYQQRLFLFSENLCKLLSLTVLCKVSCR